MAVQIIQSVVTFVDGAEHTVGIENGIVNNGHKHVDERVREPYEVAVGEALLQFADGGMADLRERVVQLGERHKFNPNFKVVESDHFKISAGLGLPSFVLRYLSPHGQEPSCAKIRGLFRL